jgi:hypothetical protein
MSQFGGGSAFFVRQHYTLMIYTTSILLCAISAILLAVGSVSIFLAPRRRMERRASALLAQHPGAEQTSVFLKLHSTFAWNKQREVDAKIAEMLPQGWTFLRIASSLPTFHPWGASVTLHFIRTTV